MCSDNSWEKDLEAIQYQNDSNGNIPRSFLSPAYLKAEEKLKEMQRNFTPESNDEIEVEESKSSEC